jgi:DNA-binding transcriptional LysR family regulator
VDTLVEHRRKFPGVEVHAVDGGNDQLLCALARDAIDIAITTSAHPGWGDRALSLWRERVIVDVPERHALGKYDAVHWRQLANQIVLLPESGPGPELERLLRTRLHDIGPRHISHQDTGLDRLLSLVSAGYGVLIMRNRTAL